MKEKKDNWERLHEMSEEYEYDPNIVKRAIEQIEKEKSEMATEKSQKTNWFQKQWKPIAVALATCAVVLAVCIPLYRSFSSPPSLNNSTSDLGDSSSSIIYNEEVKLTIASVEDVKTFVQENELSIKYFDYPNTINHSAVVEETGEFAYLKQEMLYIGVDGFDKVTLYSVALTDIEYDFEEFYNGETQTIFIEDILVLYSYKEEIGTNKKEILFKFSYENAEYYLILNTGGEVESKIEQFVAMLIG